ncbi:hypothetical protein CPC16_010253 [Podila verticillata]|nr:hypothetical protein CPC16_010253 [Podila verticillata]KAI9231868.1 MAG: hypothetical protein BYD32DRAFT_429780 [Podila humilis]KFH70002.1 hypothetical protein MVEG_04805 [Podila verticillata NRRL 6337]
MLKSAIIAFALFVMSVTARDDRITYKLKSGQTVDQFCSAWSQECYKYVPAHQPGAEVGELCEAGPRAGEAQAYCDGYTVTEHGAAVAKILHD